jgi:hypothetical protein
MVVDPFWDGRKSEAHRKNKLCGEVWSVGGNGGGGGGGAASGVVVGSSRCMEVVLGSVVLVVWSRRSERGRSRLSMVA